MPAESHGCVIVGAGPTGLGVAHARPPGAIVLEASDGPGGLCRSFERRGGVFDIGGHSFHTPIPRVRDLVLDDLGLAMEATRRTAFVHTHGVLVPYPFQESFRRIPDPAVVEECEEGLRRAPGGAGAADFEEWIVSRFGEGIARHFMLPYNRKLWARDLSRIATDWVGERVAGSEDGVERFEERGGRRTPLQADTRVHYPAEGGFGRIWEALAARQPTRIDYGEQVVDVDLEGRWLRTRSGREIAWRRLVSTMPVTRLVEIAHPVPESIVASARALEVMSLVVVWLLVGRRLTPDVQRIYSASGSYPAHKTALNHNSTTELARRSVHAIMAEVSFSRDEPVDPEVLPETTIEGLVGMGIIDSGDDVVWSSHREVPHAYPVHTHERTAIITAIREYLAGHGVVTIGRFGGWEYKNSDACLDEGIDVGEKLAAEGG